MVTGPFTIPAPAPGTWGTVTLPAPQPLTPGTRYRAVIFHPAGAYAATGAYFTADQVAGPLVAPASATATAGAQGSYAYGPAIQYPTQTFNSAAYYADVTVTDVDPAPLIVPTDGANIDVTAALGHRRWDAAMPTRDRHATLEPRRWAGTL
jgi:hypothetical protein